MSSAQPIKTSDNASPVSTQKQKSFSSSTKKIMKALNKARYVLGLGLEGAVAGMAKNIFEDDPRTSPLDIRVHQSAHLGTAINSINTHEILNNSNRASVMLNNLATTYQGTYSAKVSAQTQDGKQISLQKDEVEREYRTYEEELNKKLPELYKKVIDNNESVSSSDLSSIDRKEKDAWAKVNKIKINADHLEKEQHIVIGQMRPLLPSSKKDVGITAPSTKPEME